MLVIIFFTPITQSSRDIFRLFFNHPFGHTVCEIWSSILNASLTLGEWLDWVLLRNIMDSSE